MPEVLTHADSLRFYLSGAESDGGVQADPDLSLGLYRSSSEVASLVQAEALPEGTIDFVSGSNGIGTGNIEFINPSDVKWTAPGGVQGAAVTIADGETKLLEDTTVSKFTRFTRNQAGAFANNNEDVELTYPPNNGIATADLTGDQTKYDKEFLRSVIMRNVHAADDITSLKFWLDLVGTLTGNPTVSQLPATGPGEISRPVASFTDWPKSGWCLITFTGAAFDTREIVYYYARTDYTLYIGESGRGRMGTYPSAGVSTDGLFPIPGFQFAVEAPSAQSTGYFSSIISTGQTEIPAGLAWYNEFLVTGAISVPTLAAGEIYALWFKHDVVGGMSSLLEDLAAMNFSFTV